MLWPSTTTACSGRPCLCEHRARPCWSLGSRLAPSWTGWLLSGLIPSSRCRPCEHSRTQRSRDLPGPASRTSDPLRLAPEDVLVWKKITDCSCGQDVWEAHNRESWSTFRGALPDKWEIRGGLSSCTSPLHPALGSDGRRRCSGAFPVAQNLQLGQETGGVV